MADENDIFDTKIDEGEVAAAQKLAAEASGDVSTHKFSKPLVYMGKTYETMTMNFAILTGDDGLAIENEMAVLGKAVIIPSFSGEYLIRMAVRASDERIGVDAFRIMPLSDYNRIRSKARSFLLKSE